jgi:hypothetical protein
MLKLRQIAPARASCAVAIGSDTTRGALGQHSSNAGGLDSAGGFHVGGNFSGSAGFTREQRCKQITIVHCRVL